MVGSAAIKQGRSANRKHTYFFFGLSAARDTLYQLTSADTVSLVQYIKWNKRHIKLCFLVSDILPTTFSE